MFIPDERFQAIFGEADTWTLQVKYVQARDEGEYECQISTDPKKSHIIKLNIVGERRGGRVGPRPLSPPSLPHHHPPAAAANFRFLFIGSVLFSYVAGLMQYIS